MCPRLGARNARPCGLEGNGSPAHPVLARPPTTCPQLFASPHQEPLCSADCVAGNCGVPEIQLLSLGTTAGVPTCAATLTTSSPSRADPTSSRPRTSLHSMNAARRNRNFGREHPSARQTDGASRAARVSVACAARPAHFRYSIGLGCPSGCAFFAKSGGC